MTKKAETIKVTIHNLGKVYTSNGKTLKETILKIKTPIIKGTGVFIVEKGNKRKEKVLNARIINNIFGQVSPTSKELSIKNIINLFSDFDK